MAKYVVLEVDVNLRSDEAVQITFHPDLPEEEEIWVPKSIIHPDYRDRIESAADGIEVCFAKWFLIKNDIEYKGIGYDY